MEVYVLGGEVYELGWGFHKIFKKIALKIKKVAKRIGKAAGKADAIATAFLTGGWTAAAATAGGYSYPNYYQTAYRPTSYLRPPTQPQGESSQFQNLLPLLAVGAGVLLLLKKR